MTKDPLVYLAHILKCLGKIERYTEQGKDRFFADPMVRDAVFRNFELIGEAAKRIDDACRGARPEIPWRALAGLRAVLIHQYYGVDLSRVWALVERDLPQIKAAVEMLLPSLDALERRLAGEDETSPEA